MRSRIALKIGIPCVLCGDNTGNGNRILFYCETVRSFARMRASARTYCLAEIARRCVRERAYIASAAFDRQENIERKRGMRRDAISKRAGFRAGALLAREYAIKCKMSRASGHAFRSLSLSLSLFIFFLFFIFSLARREIT